MSVRRRLDRKWQETPLAHVFTIASEWHELKHRALAGRMLASIRGKSLSRWEAFTVFDADDNGKLSAEELFGALRWLRVPAITAVDVLDALEQEKPVGDRTLNFGEFSEMLLGGEEEQDEARGAVNSGRRRVATELRKAPPHGADELRQLVVERRKEYIQKQRDERLRQQIFHATMEAKLFADELQASAARRGGANPMTHPATAECAGVIEFKFCHGDQPLRLISMGECKLNSFPKDESVDATKRFLPRCMYKGPGHVIVPFSEMSVAQRKGFPDTYRHTYCKSCYDDSRGVHARCISQECRFRTTSIYCQECFNGLVQDQYGGALREFAERAKLRPEPIPETFLTCDIGASASVQFPPRLDAASGTLAAYTATLEVFLPKLPPRGQYTAVLRAGALWVAVSDSGAVVASGLGVEGLGGGGGGGVGGGGVSNGSPPLDALASLHDGAKPGRCLVAGRWHAVTVTVKDGLASTYVNGSPCVTRKSLRSLPALDLDERMHLFGGIAQMHCRGGSVRRLLLHETDLSPKAVYELGYEAWGSVPLIYRAIAKVQALQRGRATRAALRSPITPRD